MEDNKAAAPVKQIHAIVEDYYTQKLSEFGPSASGVDWKDEESQFLRFRQFLRLLDGDHDASVMDVGCGYGAFLHFLRQQGFGGRYLGTDLSPAMVDAARSLWSADSCAEFEVADLSSRCADYVVASGIFNVKLDVPAEDWTSYVLRTIDGMAEKGTKGMAFNFLTSYSDEERKVERLYYANPAQLFEYCAQSYGRHVGLLHDYGLYEFTLIVRFSG